MPQNKTSIVVIVVLVAVVAVGGYFVASRYKTTPRATDQPVVGETAPNAVTIKNMAFSPITISVKTGTTITWTNSDDVKHSVTSDSDSPLGGLASSLMAKGEQFSFTFKTAGKYKYHCQVHPSMMGTVVVSD